MVIDGVPHTLSMSRDLLAVLTSQLHSSRRELAAVAENSRYPGVQELLDSI
jgi:hypothetical protein